ncbi:MAG: hypothetical protein ACRD12_05420 [Acidimicrobiales bacterium]
MESAVTPRAELSAIVAALDHLTQRVTNLAERTNAGKQDWLANDLFEAERPLGEATRRLSRALERLR